jgi:hypothetical protein
LNPELSEQEAGILTTTPRNALAKDVTWNDNEFYDLRILCSNNFNGNEFYLILTILDRYNILIISDKIC